MRTMIGKRIGPVPISLVAVLALAAFISAGLWLVPTNGAQADEHPRATITGADGTSFEDEGRTIGEGGMIELDLSEIVSVEVDFVTEYTGTPGVQTVDVEWNEPAGAENVDTATAPTAAASISVTDDKFTFTWTAPATFPTYDHDNAATTPVIPVRGLVDVVVTVDQVEGNDPNADPPTSPGPETFEFQIQVVQNPIEASGVMVTTPADVGGESYPTGAGGACEVVSNATGDALNSRMNAADTPEPFVLTSTTNRVSGGDCTTDGNSVEVEFKNLNTDADGEVEYLLYVTGGDDLDGVIPALGKAGLDEYAPHTVPAATAGFADDDNTPGENNLTVTRAMAGPEGHVYVIGYFGTDATIGAVGANNLDDESTTYGNNAYFVVDVLFRGGPDKGMSDLVIGAINKDGEAEVTITVNDKYGNPLPGQHVDFSIEASEGVTIQESGSTMRRQRTGPMGVASITVDGLPTDGAINLGVTAMVGDTVIGDESIIREGDPASVKLGNTAKGSLVEGNTFFVAARANDSAGNNVTDDVEDWEFDGGDGLMVAEDATEANAAWWDDLDCPQMVAIVSDYGDANKDNPYCKMYAELGEHEMDVVMNLEVREVTVGTGAAAGAHTVMVTADEDDSLTATTSVTVAGTPATWEFTAGPERIATNDSAMYTVTAKDADGGVPMSNECVTIKLRAEDANSAEDISVASDNRAAGCTGGNTGMLDDDGTISFTVYAPVGVAANSAGRIVVEFDGGIVAQHSVTFTGRSTVVPNRAPSAVGAISNMYLTVGDAPVTVTAGFADADGDTLGYSASSSDVAVATAMSNGGGSVTVTAVGEGTATITVTASDGQAEATQSFMVTVMAPEAPPVDTTLGSISGLRASSNAAGSATVMWYAAANADVHYIWAAPSDGSMGMYSPALAGDASSHTFTGLDSGMGYYFIAIACQTADGAITGCSAWSNWSGLVTVQ